MVIGLRRAHAKPSCAARRGFATLLAVDHARFTMPGL